MKVCAEPNCPQLQAEPRCPSHRRERERARGSASQRGYGKAHIALGRSYQDRMDAGQRFNCWRCGKTLGTKRGRDWMLGHCDQDRTRHHGPECPPCDLATAGRVGLRCPHHEHDQGSITSPQGPGMDTAEGAAGEPTGSKVPAVAQVSGPLPAPCLSRPRGRATFPCTGSQARGTNPLHPVSRKRPRGRSLAVQAPEFSIYGPFEPSAHLRALLRGLGLVDGGQRVHRVGGVSC